MNSGSVSTFPDVQAILAVEMMPADEALATSMAAVGVDAIFDGVVEGAAWAAVEDATSEDLAAPVSEVSHEVLSVVASSVLVLLLLQAF